MKILITGGAGFVGSNLAIGLKKRYESSEIIALDNLNRRGSELNVDRLIESGIEFVKADVRRQDDLKAVGKIDLIVECSAEPSVLAGYGESPRYLIDTNLVGAVNCLELAREHNAGFIFLSTSRIYPIDKVNQLSFSEEETRFVLSPEQKMHGASEKGITEEFTKEGVRSLYGSTKLSAELLIQEYIYAYGIKGVINRCGVIAGPWQMGKIDQGVIALWVASHFFKKELNYIGFGGTGKQIRDVLHIDDLLDLVDLEIKDMDKVNGGIYNVGGGQETSVSLQELTKICREVTGNTIEIGSLPETRTADIRMYITDNSKITQELNWKPKKSIEDIVSDTYDWIQGNEKILEPVFE